MCWFVLICMHVLLNDCSDTINNNWGDSPKSMLHIYKELIAAGLRIWVFRSVPSTLIYFLIIRY